MENSNFQKHQMSDLIFLEKNRDLGCNFHSGFVGKAWLCKSLKYAATGVYGTASWKTLSRGKFSGDRLKLWKLLICSLSSFHCRDNRSNAVDKTAGL